MKTYVNRGHMSVLSVRVSDNQKSEIERAALAAGLSVPEYVRRALSVGQLDSLRSQQNDTERSVASLRDELATLSKSVSITATELSQCLADADSTAKRIQRRLDSDRMWVLLSAGVIGWALALTGTMLGLYLMR